MTRPDRDQSALLRTGAGGHRRRSPFLEQPAHAQQSPAEGRLREALRQTTQQLRVLQDAQAGQQAVLDEAKRQRDLLQQTVDQQALRLERARGQGARPGRGGAA